MTRYLDTTYRVTDPQRSRGFYEAVGFGFCRELPIVRNGERDATRLPTRSASGYGGTAL